MNVKSVEKKEQFTVELIVEVGQDEFEQGLEKAYKKNRGSISVPGFRKGKAPRKVIEGMYGSGAFYQEAFEELYPVACEEAVTAEKLDIVAPPQIEVMELDKRGFTFKATVTVRPTVTLKEYKGLVADKILPTVNEAAVEKEMQAYIERASRLEVVDRPAQDGDTAMIDYEGFESGVPFAGGKGENHDLVLGSNSFIPGFEAQVVGMSAGEEKEINVTFPAEYHAPELAGKPVVFKVKLNEVKTKVAPAVDDEFAKDVSEFETLADFKADLREKVIERNTTQSEMKFKQELIAKLVEQVDIELPAPMVEAQLDQIMADYRARLESQGITLEMYFSYMQMTEQGMREELRGGAEKQIQTQLALDAVAAAENIEISDETVDEEFKKIAENMKVTIEEVEAAVPRDNFKRDMARDRALAVVAETAKPNLVMVDENGEVVVEEVKKVEEKPAKKPRAKKAAATEVDGEVAPKKTTRKKKADTEEAPKE